MKNNKLIALGMFGAGILTAGAIVSMSFASNSGDLTSGSKGQGIMNYFKGEKGEHKGPGKGNGTGCIMGSGDHKGMMGFGKEGRGRGKGMGIGMKGEGFGMGEGKGMGMFSKNPAVEAALKANDYNAFVAAHKGTSMEGKITQDMFNKMVEGYAKQQVIKAAIEANDYNAFVTAHKGTPMEGKITQDMFNKMVERSKK